MSVKQLAWEMFEQTGNIAYYNLYKRLENNEWNKKLKP